MKKQVLLTMLFAVCAVFTSSAQSTHTSILFKHHNELTTPDVAFNSSGKFHPNIAQVGYSELNTGGERSSRRYESAVHKRNAGIGLTVAGATCLTGGAALLAIGAIGWQNDIAGNSSTEFSALNHTVEVVFGTILTLAGTGMTIPGAIILAKGQRDMKKYRDSQTVN